MAVYSVERMDFKVYLNYKIAIFKFFETSKNSSFWEP